MQSFICTINSFSSASKIFLRKNRILFEAESALTVRPQPLRKQQLIDSKRQLKDMCVNVQKFMFGWMARLAIALLFVSITLPVWADSLTASAQPAALFEVHCAGCHLNGGNIIRRSKNLKLKALMQNKVDTVGAIATLITNGKNNMSAYRDKLSVSEIQALANYVLAQAQKGWPKV